MPVLCVGIVLALIFHIFCFLAGISTHSDHNPLQTSLLDFYFGHGAISTGAGSAKNFKLNVLCGKGNRKVKFSVKSYHKARNAIWPALFYCFMFSIFSARTSSRAATATFFGIDGSWMFVRSIDESPTNVAEPRRAQPLPKSA